VIEFNRVDTAELAGAEALRALSSCQHPAWRDRDWCVVCGALRIREGW
jgi:hypothetical protein